MTDWEELARSMRENALNSDAPNTVYEKVYEPSEEQKKLYFNAGRWAGGARDWTARKAAEELQKMGEM